MINHPDAHLVRRGGWRVGNGFVLLMGSSLPYSYVANAKSS